MNQKPNHVCKKSMLGLSVVRNLFFVLPLNFVMMACDNHETQYTYYDDAKSIIKEKFEIDKTSGKNDGIFQRFDQKGNVIYSVKYINGELQKDYITDKRDGRKYRITTIGNQTWMAENLNFKSNDSYCYDDDSANCEKYGRLYKWNAAVHACPDGWNLPGDDDFKMLIETAGIESLKSKSGWKSNNPKKKMLLTTEPMTMDLPYCLQVVLKGGSIIMKEEMIMKEMDRTHIFGKNGKTKILMNFIAQKSFFLVIV